jgi:hypothetical protein
MPSERPQINVRADAETHAEFLRLLQVVAAAISAPLSQAGLIKMAIMELGKKYPPPAPKRARR